MRIICFCVSFISIYSFLFMISFLISVLYLLNKNMLNDTQIVYKKKRLFYYFDSLLSPFLIRILRRHLLHRDM